jgi:hypothetical protein
MNAAADGGLSHHPAPERGRVGLPALAFGLVGGPFAWAVQLCAGSALSGVPRQGAVFWILYGATVLLACASLAVALRSYARSQRELHGGSHEELLEIGVGRTRFLAIWGVLLSSAFAIFAAANGVALVLLGAPHR